MSSPNRRNELCSRKIRLAGFVVPVGKLRNLYKVSSGKRQNRNDLRAHMRLCQFWGEVFHHAVLQHTKSPIRQSITQYLFYIYWYICQGDMFRSSRSSSGTPRKQIQEQFIFSALWDPKCSQVSVTETNVYRLYKLHLLYDGFKIEIGDLSNTVKQQVQFIQAYVLLLL